MPKLSNDVEVHGNLSVYPKYSHCIDELMVFWQRCMMRSTASLNDTVLFKSSHLWWFTLAKDLVPE